MNIACTACSARYGVADEKLVGKRVRITCKRCGTVLIVDGNYNPPTVSASTSMAPSPPISSRPPVESRRPAPPPEPPFTVTFADGRQEQADVAQIVRFHRSGSLGTDSVVWREGMADWADPWDVPDIAAAFRRMGYARPTPMPSSAPALQALREPVEEEATQIHRSNPQHAAPPYGDSEDTHVVPSSRRGAASAERDHRVASRPVVEDDEVPTHVGAPTHGTARRVSPSPRETQRARRVSTQPSTRESTEDEYQRARREAKALTSARARSSRPPARRSEPAPDMFARQARAGSEEEAVEQASYGAAQDDGPRLTGARNESSVLFSLDTLLKQDQKKSAPPPARPRREESLLVDTGGSLPIGGGIAPALAAPDFTAPISAPPPAPRFAEPLTFEDTGRTRSRAWLYVAVLAVFGGGVALAWKAGALEPLLVKAGMSTPPIPAVPVPSSTAPAESPARPADSAAVTAPSSASAEASASAAPPVASATTPVTVPRAAAAQPAPRATSGNAQASSSRQTSTGTKESAATPKEAPDSDEGSSKEAAAKEGPAKEAPASSGATGPFDAAAAKEALSGATANVASCKEMGGPTGNGRVSITFAPSGRPTSVAVTGDLAGTTVGSCIARLYRAVRVPAFSGDAVTVAKGFSVQ